MTVLLVCFGFGLPYRVLRCAAALDLRVFVLGGGDAWKLGRSRFCAGFFGMDQPPDSPPDDFVALVNNWAERLEVDMVLPSDHESFRILSMVKARIDVPVFPVPDAEQYRILSNKDDFSRFCRAVGAPHPKTELVAGVAEIGQCGLPFPVVVKPTNRSGGEGVKVIRGPGDTLVDLDYRPILVQQFIDGEDISCTVFVHNGRVIVAQSYRRQKDCIVFETHDPLIDQCSKLILSMNVDGLFNFDARVEAKSGDIYLIECNPRFFYTMDYAAVAGVNFVALGLDESHHRTPRPEGFVSLGGPIDSLRKLARLSWPSADDLRMLRHFLADPLPPFLYEEIPWRKQKWFGAKI